MVTVANFDYLDDLHLMRLKVRAAGNDGSLFIVSKPYRFSYDLDGDAKKFAVPDGLKTDFASIPRLLRWLVSRTGGHTEASVVHDFLYLLRKPETQRLYRDVFGEDPPAMDREEADKAFRSALAHKDAGLGCFTRTIMYFAVTTMGWWVYGDVWEKPWLRVVVFLTSPLVAALLLWGLFALWRWSCTFI